jgi:catechol 2,3-dioxygenase-like lactoylglutathione lyase family enzyme
MAQEVVARENRAESWTALKHHIEQMKTAKTPILDEDKRKYLCVAYPQLFVQDVAKSAKYYEQKLGFKVAYLYGNPPFYGLVTRDGAGMNLRFVHKHPFDHAEREEQQLLSASIPVNGVKNLFLEFKEREVEFFQSLKLEPWGAWVFIVKDPDGNLIGFGSQTADQVSKDPQD